MRLNNNQQAFFALVRAGLWEQESRLLPIGKVDFPKVLLLSEEQSVVGLVAAGLERVKDIMPAKHDLLSFIGQTLQLEQQNTAMNNFIGVLIDKMREVGIYTLLVKGQGVAQCYKRPLWRTLGDVDLFMDEKNYEKAKTYLTPLASKVEKENVSVKHIGMTIDSWIVELHGTLHCGLSLAMDSEIDALQEDTITNNKVRIWNNDGVEVHIPTPENDVLFIFTHIIKHFYKGGIGIRQICDWSQLIWTFHEEIDNELLRSRLKRMKLLDEWHAFASFIVDYLGHPADALPLYEANRKWSRKAMHIYMFVMGTGNFGHNRDLSYYGKYNLVFRKAISFLWRLRDLFTHAIAFPKSAIRFFPYMLYDGFRSAFKSI